MQRTLGFAQRLNPAQRWTWALLSEHVTPGLTELRKRVGDLPEGAVLLGSKSAALGFGEYVAQRQDLGADDFHPFERRNIVQWLELHTGAAGALRTDTQTASRLSAVQTGVVRADTPRTTVKVGRLTIHDRTIRLN